MKAGTLARRRLEWTRTSLRGCVRTAEPRAALLACWCRGIELLTAAGVRSSTVARASPWGPESGAGTCSGRGGWRTYLPSDLAGRSPMIGSPTSSAFAKRTKTVAYGRLPEKWGVVSPFPASLCAA